MHVHTHAQETPGTGAVRDHAASQLLCWRGQAAGAGGALGSRSKGLGLVSTSAGAVSKADFHKGLNLHFCPCCLSRAKFLGRGTSHTVPRSAGLPVGTACLPLLPWAAHTRLCGSPDDGRRVFFIYTHVSLMAPAASTKPLW